MLLTIEVTDRHMLMAGAVEAAARRAARNEQLTGFIDAIDFTKPPRIDARGHRPHDPPNTVDCRDCGDCLDFDPADARDCPAVGPNGHRLPRAGRKCTACGGDLSDEAIAGVACVPRVAPVVPIETARSHAAPPPDDRALNIRRAMRERRGR